MQAGGENLQKTKRNGSPYFYQGIVMVVVEVKDPDWIHRTTLVESVDGLQGVVVVHLNIVYTLFFIRNRFIRN